MRSSKNVLITGASGLIGSRLTTLLQQDGHQVKHLVRSKKATHVPTFLWDVDRRQLDANALASTDAMIHLAGAGVADQRWTNARKTEILESRTQSTRLLFDAVQRNQNGIRAIVSASAIGIYGFQNGNAFLDEQANFGNDFLADVTTRWEREVDRFQELGIRVVKLRIGIVLSDKGGALAEIAKPVKNFVGAAIGSGNQHVSWIHIDDLCHMFIHAIKTPSMIGAYNAVAPNPVTNRELTKEIANSLHRPLLLPAVPAFAMKLLFGEMGDIVLNGSKISADKITKTGFRFQYPNMKEAVNNLLSV